MALRERLVAIAAFCLCILPAPVSAQTPFEARVMAALNFARSDPRAYAQSLRATRRFFQRTVYSAPGSSEDVITFEGVDGLDDAIAFLTRQPPLPPVMQSGVLDRTAAALTVEQNRSGQVGHYSADGASPGDRARRTGGGDYVAEVIAYGHADAEEAVRQLIVDDGVADRGHRGVLFSPDLRFAGVSCGPHRVYGTICVVDLATTADGRFTREIRVARADPVEERRRN